MVWISLHLTLFIYLYKRGDREIPTSPVSGYDATKDIEALRADSPALNPLTGTDARSDARTSLTIIYPTTDTANDTADSGESGLRITWWRLLNSVVLVVFGVVKAVKAFQGKAIISNAFDVVLGVIWALMYVSQLQQYSICLS